MEVNMGDKLFSLDNYPSLANSEAFFERIISDDGATKRIFGQFIILCLFLFVYGIVMGAYQSFIQAITAGVKLAVLFNLTLLICFPAFFIVQFILGSRLKLHQMISIIISGFVLMASIMLSFTPIVIIFLLTGSNYYFLHLLHVAIFVFAGIFGMNTIVQALKYSCEKKNVYPRTGVVVFRFWVIILAFVGIQLAWSFRPFLGVKGRAYELFAHREGNFYAAMIYAVDQLISPNQPKSEGDRDDISSPYNPQTLDTDWIEHIGKDSADGQ
jgi:hypothetical protein